MGEPEDNKPEDEDKKEDAAPEEGAADSDSSDADEADENKPFSQLDLREWYCFGIECPKENSWTSLAMRSRTEGWNRIDVRALERSLKTNVDASYLQLASFYLVNLEDETRWHCWFDNASYLWCLEISDSPKAEVEIETKAEFFSSDMFKKIASRTSELLERADSEYHNVVEFHLRNGKLLAVDEVKLNAIVYLLSQKITIENIRNGKWAK